MFVFKTDRFLESVERHGLASFVASREEKLRAALTQAQASRIGKFDSGFIKTRVENYRLIGSVEKFNDRYVFVWHEILKRGDGKYDVFSNYSGSIRQRLDFSSLQDWVSEQIRQEIEAARPPDLPDNLYHWLQPIHSISVTGDSSDVLVYETRDWVADMEGRTPDRWPIYKLVTQAIEELAAGSLRVSDSVIEKSDDLFQIFLQKTENKSIYLLGISRKDEKHRVIKSIPNGEAAQPYARRSYPSWLLADQQLWFDIQEGEAYNLALSPEEQFLLQRAAGLTSDGSVLPMFINGQAGSGKSTMLAYIFAGLCKMWLHPKKDVGGTPLFITYNPHLLSKTKDTTRKILNADHSNAPKLKGINLDELFYTWHRYLTSILPEDEQIRFNPQRRVDYNDFVTAWNGRSGKLPVLQIPRGDFSTAMVWYVIRSLIKGSDAVGELSPDDYEVELSRDEQTVLRDQYKRIFDTFYSQWYAPALREQNLWDDQDLTERALTAVDDSDQIHQIAALVIDEAQDFTRRELRLITRTTVFSLYEPPILGTGIHPPIVLAGDPLQTLSPTGFRWSAIKAGIHEELKGLFGAQARDPLFTELLKNYRSVEPIVKLANSIQLWRAHLFALQDVRPQDAWSPDEDVIAPERFSLDQIEESDFIRFAADTVLVVPCEEGGEIDYVQQDETLSKMFPEASEQSPPATVFSASSIKGLEYEKVLLYKFGESARGLSWSPTVEGTRDLLSEYFFNKLYVAVTRATRSLYVVDTPEGDKALWSHLSHESVIRLLKDANIKRPSGFSESDLAGIEYGSSEFAEVQEQNPLVNARKTRDYAIETRSSRKMQQAASYFRRSGNRSEAMECEALALEFEGDLLGAAEKFEQANLPDLSWRCLWESQAWERLDELTPKVESIHPVQLAASKFIATTNCGESDLKLLSQAIIDAERVSDFRGGSWAGVSEKFASEVDVHRTWTDKDSREIIARGLDILWESGQVRAAFAAIDLYSEIGNRLRARQILERLPQTDLGVATRLYEIEGPPGGLRHLAAASLSDKIREAWIENGRSLEASWLDFVVPVLGEDRFAKDRIKIYLEQGNLDEAKKALLGLKFTNSDFSDLAIETVEAYGGRGLASGGVDLINEVMEMPLVRLKSSRISKLLMHQHLIVSLALSYERRKWSIPERELRGLQEVVDSICQVARGRNQFEKLGSEAVSSLGAVCEVAENYRWARKVYSSFADGPVSPLRDYCRKRYLLMATRILSDKDLRSTDRAKLQEEQHQMAERWKLPVDQRTHQRVALLEQPERELEVPQPSGSLGAVTWAKTGEETIRIGFDDGGSLFESARISLIGDQHRHSQEVEIDELDSSAIKIKAGPFSVQIIMGDEMHLSVLQDDEEIGRFLIERKVGLATVKPASTNRTRPGTQSNSRSPRNPNGQGNSRTQTVVHRLAGELEISVKELLRIAQSLDIGCRRGTDKLSFDEVVRIRDAVQKGKNG